MMSDPSSGEEHRQEEEKKDDTSLTPPSSGLLRFLDLPLLSSISQYSYSPGLSLLGFVRAEEDTEEDNASGNEASPSTPEDPNLSPPPTGSQDPNLPVESVAYRSWKGRVPIRIILAEEDLASPSRPIPVYVSSGHPLISSLPSCPSSLSSFLPSSLQLMVPRNHYLPCLWEVVRSQFLPFAPAVIDEIWFRFQELPLPWSA